MLLILFVVFNIKLGEMISVSASVLFEHFQLIIYNTMYNTVIIPLKGLDAVSV